MIIAIVEVQVLFSAPSGHSILPPLVGGIFSSGGLRPFLHSQRRPHGSSKRRDTCREPQSQADIRAGKHIEHESRHGTGEERRLIFAAYRRDKCEYKDNRAGSEDDILH